MSKRAPRPRGIFGLPSQNMLFSFTPRVGEEWPEEVDDDNDSDYEPGSSLKPMVEDVPRDSDSDGSDWANDFASSSKRKRKSKSPASKGKTKKRKVEKSKTPKKKRANKKGTTPKRDCKTRGVDKRTQRASGRGEVRTKREKREIQDGDDIWGQHLPLIALEKILLFAVQEVGVVPLLCRASRVCSLWRDAVQSSSLWHHVDLDNGRVKGSDSTLEWLTRNRFPSQLTSINLNSWAKLTDRGFVTLAEACPNMENISLQRCIKLTIRSLCAIKDHCRNLKHLDIGFTGNSLVSSPSMRDLLKERGQTLEELHLAGCSISSSASLLNSIKSCCPSLRVLDLSSCQVTVECLMLPVEDMQRGCPLLEVLRLAGTRVQAANASTKAKKEAPGFTKLKELSLAVSDDIARAIVVMANLGVSDDFLQRVLKGSRDLKLLDVRGCAYITLQTVKDLPVDNLDELYISRCSVSRHEGVDVIVSKWSHSLVELDLSWNTYPEAALKSALKTLSSSKRLLSLDLSGTNVSMESVQNILFGCRRIRCLKLTSCRSLPRGTKRWYEGDSLQELRNEILNGVYESEDGNK